VHSVLLTDVGRRCWPTGASLGYSDRQWRILHHSRVVYVDVEGGQVLQKVLDWARGEVAEDINWPVCPVHGERMELFKTVGAPTRFTDQETGSYTLLFRCPVPGCDEQQTRQRLRTQIPVPGERTVRPSWAKRDS
jgi:hypothetical protein